MSVKLDVTTPVAPIALSNQEPLSISNNARQQQALPNNLQLLQEIHDQLQVQAEIENSANCLMEELKSGLDHSTGVESVEQSIHLFVNEPHRGLPKELVQAANDHQKNRSLFSIVLNNLPSLNILPFFSSCISKAITYIFQTEDAKKEQETLAFSETLTKLRLLGEIGPTLQIDLINSARFTSGDRRQILERQLHIKSVLQQTFSRVSEYSNSVFTSEHLHSHLAAGSYKNAAEEIYAHALIKKMRNEQITIDLSDVQAQTLIDVDSALSEGKPLRHFTSLLEGVYHQQSAHSWVQNILENFQTTLPSYDITPLVDAVKRGDAESTRSKLNELLESVASQESNPEIDQEKILAKEMLACLTTYPNGELFSALGFQKLQESYSRRYDSKLLQFSHRLDRNMHLNEKTIASLNQLNKAVMSLGTCQKVARIAPTLIAKSFGSCSLVSKKITQINSVNKSIDKAIPQAGRSLSIEANAARERAGLPKKKISIWSWGCGNGHNSCTNNLKNNFETPNNQYDIQITDGLRDVLLDQDVVNKTLGNYFVDDKKRPYATDSLFNFLMHKDLLSILKLLMNFSSGEPSETSREINKARIRERLIEERPELLILSYRMHSEDIMSVADELGIPVLQISTDFDYELTGDLTKYRHVKQAVPSKENALAMQTVKMGTLILDNQIIECGLPVNKGFENQISDEELQAIRQELEIQPNEKIVVVSSGGVGVQNDIPEHLAKNYHDVSNPIRIVVLAGKNEEFKKDLETRICPALESNPAVKMKVLSFTQKVPQIFSVADLLIGKAGGLTSFEARKKMIPMIIDESKNGIYGHRMDWEHLNAKILVHDGLGAIINKTSQIVDTVTSMLKKPKLAPDALSLIKASERIVETAVSMIESSEQDEEFKKKRALWFSRS